MEVFRICKEKYSTSLVSSGSANRWNERGQKVLYTCSTRSLTTLELIVHNSSVVPGTDYRVLVISISDKDNLLRLIQTADLPVNWRKMEAYSALQRMGSKWYKNRETLILKVPSAVIPAEYNYIINTEHPEFEEHIQLVRSEDYFWDERLLN